jgi:hypothetical protein
VRNLLGALSMCAGLAACSQGAAVPADYCAAVAAHSKAESAVLAEMFDNFAASGGLSIDRSNPAARDYEDSAKEVHLSVSFGMGDHGAIVSLFHGPKTPQTILRSQLEQFMSDVANRYKVTRCSDISGFQNPVIYKNWGKD